MFFSFFLDQKSRFFWPAAPLISAQVSAKSRYDRFGLKNLLETLRQILGSVWQPILLIWIVMVVRAQVGQSLMAVMPVLGVQQGHTIVSAGVLFYIFYYRCLSIIKVGVLSCASSGHVPV